MRESSVKGFSESSFKYYIPFGKYHFRVLFLFIDCVNQLTNENNI